MSFADKKLEMSILGLSIIMVAGVSYLLKSPIKSVIEDVEAVIYEMPRPKNSFLAALFDLGEREVSRKYVNPFAKKKEEVKKAPEAAKTAAVTPKKAVAQVAKKEQKKSEEVQKKQVDVQVVGDAPETKWEDDGFFATTGQNKSRVAGSGGSSEKKIQTQQTKNNMSGAQWRSLLMAQPTTENVSKFLQAYQVQEVDDQTFYQVVGDLFRSNKVETQALGLSAVKFVYSPVSFSLTAQHYEQMTPELQQKAHEYLMSYGVAGRLPFLMSVLQGNNPVAVEAAVQVVVDGYSKAKDGVVPTADPRIVRGEVATNSVAGYSKFVPIFQQLAQSADAGIANIAKSALSQIQTAVAAL